MSPRPRLVSMDEVNRLRESIERAIAEKPEKTAILLSDWIRRGKRGNGAGA